MATPASLQTQIASGTVDSVYLVLGDDEHEKTELVAEFDSLVEHGFRGPESEKVLLMIDGLNKIETDTDGKGIIFTKQLFAHEQELNPVSVILWLRIGRLIGDLANFAERTGNRHRLLIAR